LGKLFIGHFGPTQVGPAQVGPTQTSLTQIGPVQVSAAQVGLAQYDPSSSKTVQMKKKNPPRRCLTADGLLRCSHDAVGAIAAPVIASGWEEPRGFLLRSEHREYTTIAGKRQGGSAEARKMPVFPVEMEGGCTADAVA
jgi:hypothetical protein